MITRAEAVHEVGGWCRDGQATGQRSGGDVGGGNGGGDGGEGDGHDTDAAGALMMVADAAWRDSGHDGDADTGGGGRDDHHSDGGGDVAEKAAVDSDEGGGERSKAQVRRQGIWRRWTGG
jgi:hypothetical protein